MYYTVLTRMSLPARMSPWSHSKSMRRSWRSPKTTIIRSSSIGHWAVRSELARKIYKLASTRSTVMTSSQETSSNNEIADKLNILALSKRRPMRQSTCLRSWYLRATQGQKPWKCRQKSTSKNTNLLSRSTAAAATSRASANCRWVNSLAIFD